MTDYSKAIELWTMYGFNFEHDFVKKAFAGENEMMIKHLESKFNEAYDIAGTYGAFFYFWSMLDSHNKRVLESYVMDNYKC